MADRKIRIEGNPLEHVGVFRLRDEARQILIAVAQLREGEEPRFPKPDYLELLAHDYLTITAAEGGSSPKDAPTMKHQDHRTRERGDARHIIPDPYPENVGATALSIWVPDDFRGDAEITWWYPDKGSDEDTQRLTCSAAWLLQGIFHDVRGAARPSGAFDARIVALVVHDFYRLRIEAAARLEAAYQWQSYVK